MIWNFIKEYEIASPTKDIQKIDDIFKLRAKTSWRPDNLNTQSGTEIAGYRTDVAQLIENCAISLEKVLNNTQGSVLDMRDKLSELVASDFNSGNRSWENETYFNAGYVNTPIDKNDEDDRYVAMRLKVKSMNSNKCYGKGKALIYFLSVILKIIHFTSFVFNILQGFFNLGFVTIF